MAVFLDIPDAKPAYELIDGKLHQKMSPKTAHTFLQAWFVLAFSSWAKAHGYGVGPEWRFRIADGERRHALVPDVAMMLLERLRGLEGNDYDEPPFAPDLAVEVLSPGENKRRLALKIDAYLRYGSKVVLVVDQFARTVTVHEPSGARSFAQGDVIELAAFPGLTLDLAALFAVLER